MYHISSSAIGRIRDKVEQVALVITDANCVMTVVQCGPIQLV